jgi:hypothetical protein
VGFGESTLDNPTVAPGEEYPRSRVSAANLVLRLRALGDLSEALELSQDTDKRFPD